MLTSCPWCRVQRILNHYTGGCCSYEVRERAVTGKHILTTVRITIHAQEGTFYRDGTGLERPDVDSYGDLQSNAESMAFTPLRSVSRLCLVSPGRGEVWFGAAYLQR